jgi:DNA-binding MarR family transcriptional regulator
MPDCQQNSLGRRIYLISQAIRNNVERLLKPFDLTSEQLHLLKNLDRQEGRTQRQIGAATGKSAANTTRILDRLEKKNLIVRRENPEDRRSQIVLLTVEGEELRKEMSRLLEALSTRIEEYIDNQDMAVVVRVLGRIEENLLHLAKDPGD